MLKYHNGKLITQSDIDNAIKRYNGIIKTLPDEVIPPLNIIQMQFPIRCNKNNLITQSTKNDGYEYLLNSNLYIPK